MYKTGRGIQHNKGQGLYTLFYCCHPFRINLSPLRLVPVIAYSYRGLYAFFIAYQNTQKHLYKFLITAVCHRKSLDVSDLKKAMSFAELSHPGIVIRVWELDYFPGNHHIYPWPHHILSYSG
jgi:hypothetical protein